MTAVSTPRPTSRLRVASVPGPASGTEYQRTLFDHTPRCDVVDLAVGRLPPRHVDVHHWHWPETIPGFSGRIRAAGGHAWLRTCRLRSRGAKWVWTVHNLDPHTTVDAWSRWVGGTWLPQLAGVVFLSTRSAQEARARWPGMSDLPTLVTRHQAFDDLGVRRAARDGIRRDLRLPVGPRLVGIAGRPRPDKGLAALLEAWPEGTHESTSLVVWGPLDQGTRAALAARARGPGILVRDEEMSDLRLRQVLRALDVTLLPYAAGTNSGMAILSASVGTPVIGLRGVWSEALAEDLPDGIEVADHVDDLVERALDGAPARHRMVRLPDRFEPARVGSAHQEFYASLADP